jgi:hypothetical protein
MTQAVWVLTGAAHSIMVQGAQQAAAMCVGVVVLLLHGCLVFMKQGVMASAVFLAALLALGAATMLGGEGDALATHASGSSEDE